MNFTIISDEQYDMFQHENTEYEVFCTSAQCGIAMRRMSQGMCVWCGEYCAGDCAEHEALTIVTDDPPRDVTAETVALRLWRDCFEDSLVSRGYDVASDEYADAYAAVLAAVREYLEVSQ
jgi:hypothetical protein